MNIAIITGLYATDDFPSGGSFIYERIKELRKADMPLHVYAISRRYSAGMRLIYRVILNKKLENHFVMPWGDCHNFTTIYDYVNIPLFLISVVIPNLYWKLKKKSLLQKISVTPDTILHAHWAYPHGFFAVKLAKEKNLKSVITCHGSDIHTAPSISPLLRRITVGTIQSADKTIFVSNALLDSATDLGYAGENAVVISNGVDISKFTCHDKCYAREKTGWKQTKRYVVGFVGNLIPIKRADKFVDIFRTIQKIVEDVEFIVVGDGYLAKEIKRDCLEAGLTVTFTGRVPHDDICNWLNLFDVLILPSREESWGCVVQEAYACGVPVVGASVGGIPESVGELCPLVDEGENFEERFADVVSKVLLGEYSVDPELLISWVEEHTWKKCVEKEIEVYNNICN